MRAKAQVTNLCAPIPTPLKDQIDALLVEADIPIGKVVKKLAEWLAAMTPEQVRMFVYGPGQEAFEAYIHRQVLECLDGEEGRARLDALVTAFVADAVSKK